MTVEQLNNPDIEIDSKKLLELVDFKKLATTTGIEGLELIEQGKVFQAQLDYQSRCQECMLDMLMEIYKKKFGDALFKKAYLKHFPQGRQHYLDKIKDADKQIQAMQDKVFKLLADLQNSKTAKTLNGEHK